MQTPKMTLKAKLLLAFSIPASTAIVMAVVIFFSVRAMMGASHWVDHTHRVIAKAKALSASMIDMETGMRGFLVAGKDVFLEPYIAGQRQFAETITDLKTTVSDNPPQVARLEGIEKLSEEWRTNAAEVFIALRRQVGPEGITMTDVAAEIEKGAGKRYMDELRRRIDEFVNIERKLIVIRTEEAERVGSITISVTVVGSLLSLLVVGLATFLITRDIRKQLGGEPSVMESISAQIASGDLTVKFDETKPSGMYAAMMSMSHNLADMVQQVREASGAINSSAEEIARGNLYLSERTEQQASSLEETAASMEELTATVRQNTANARSARDLAQAASRDADHGTTVVAKAVSAMSEINDSSRKIAAIISMIDEIAFQTNLLALNAAVEAARAGEQGRGFAVVAQEVRNLAAQSANAASEISDLITDSVDKVDEGTKLVNASGDVLNGILESIKQLSSNVSEIAASSEEQYSGIEQVNSAINQMDQVTQQNAALVEEAAAASQAMQNSAESLEQLMSFFQVGQIQTGLPRLER